GDIVVLFARFVIVLRQFNGIVAGTLEMPWPRFLLYNAIGAALWIGVWGGGTYWLGERFFRYLHSIGWTGHPLVFLSFAVVVLLFVLGRVGKWPRRTRRRPAPPREQDRQSESR